MLTPRSSSACSTRDSRHELPRRIQRFHKYTTNLRSIIHRRRLPQRLGDRLERAALSQQREDLGAAPRRVARVLGAEASHELELGLLRGAAGAQREREGVDRAARRRLGRAMFPLHTLQS